MGLIVHGTQIAQHFLSFLDYGRTTRPFAFLVTKNYHNRAIGLIPFNIPDEDTYAKTTTDRQMHNAFEVH
jgi:hypothetical protein